MQLFFGIAYLLVGLFQLFAIMDGVGHFLNVGGFLSFIIALLLTYIPIVGSIAGVYGATEVWDWTIWQSALLFFWYVPVFIILYFAGLIADR